MTLAATVTKNWNTVTETTEDGCPTSRRSVGTRTITLRSTIPSTVVVTFGAGRVSYSPASVRFLRTDVRLKGSRTIRTGLPCETRTVRSVCRPMRRVVGGGQARFFRKSHDELAFYATRIPKIAAGCPGESAAVRAIRPGLHQAEGEISEATLADPRAASQTGLASSEITTDLDGTEKGEIVERVHWALTFTRIS